MIFLIEVQFNKNINYVQNDGKKKKNRGSRRWRRDDHQF